MTVLIAIPARYASTRYPGKPLVSLRGPDGEKTLIRRSWEAAMTVRGVDRVVVATDDDRIKAHAEGFGAEVVMTSSSAQNGTERCAEVVQQLTGYDVVVNLQGDLPTIPPAFIRAVLAPLSEPGIDIATLVAPITSADEAAAASVVKAACAFEGGRAVAPALYFSRAAIPWGEGPLWHHIGIYAFRRTALARFVALPESPLERRESLEQLRALEAGMRIACARVSHAPFGVDTPADLERARRELGPT
jgi:3-deoxy-manno-octulosonate cytidylyltransferase (CMP-KDO synthetase)